MWGTLLVLLNVSISFQLKVSECFRYECSVSENNSRVRTHNAAVVLQQCPVHTWIRSYWHRCKCLLWDRVLTVSCPPPAIIYYAIPRADRTGRTATACGQIQEELWRAVRDMLCQAVSRTRHQWQVASIWHKGPESGIRWDGLCYVNTPARAHAKGLNARPCELRCQVVRRPLSAKIDLALGDKELAHTLMNESADIEAYEPEPADTEGMAVKAAANRATHPGLESRYAFNSWYWGGF